MAGEATPCPTTHNQRGIVGIPAFMTHIIGCNPRVKQHSQCPTTCIACPWLGPCPPITVHA